jgi:hypothetical protein
MGRVTDEERVNVTLTDVHGELRQLNVQFAMFMASVEEREKHRADHEARLRQLERFKAAVPASLATAAASAAASLVALLT